MCGRYKLIPLIALLVGLGLTVVALIGTKEKRKYITLSYDG